LNIRSIQLEQFKKFDQPVLIEGFSDGLNLIAGPNEMGKSTLLLALRAALFERHGSKSQAIKSLQPNHIQGAAPSVTVEIELEDGLYRIEKRFLRRPLARLTQPKGEIVEGNEAEVEIRKALRLEQDDALPLDKGSPGHFGVMLIPQSQSFYQPSFAQGTRHTLEEAITAEIEQLGNQSEVDAVLANVEMAVLDIVDKRSKPKGRYKDVEERIVDLHCEIDALKHDRDELADDIDALSKAEKTLRSLEDDEGEEDLEARLADLEGKRGELTRRKETEANIAAARLRVERLMMTRDQRQKRKAVQAGLLAELDQLKQEETAFQSQLAERETELKDHVAKRQSLAEADDMIHEKRRSLERLNTELKQRAEIENALLAVATEVTIDLDSEALDRVRLDGRAVDQTREVVQVVDGLDIDIQDVGRIKVLPKIDQLDRLREHRATLDRSIADLIEPLGLEDIEPEPIEVLWRETEEEVAALKANRTELDDIVKDLEQGVLERRHAVLTLVTKRQQAEERLAALSAEGDANDQDDDQTDEQLTLAQSELAAVLDVEKACSPNDPTTSVTLDQLESEIKKLRVHIEQRARDIGEAKVTISRLGGKVAVRAGRGLDERLDDGLRRLEILTREQARFQLDAKALTLLKSTLTEAANDAKAQFHAPLAARLTPYLQSLLPDAEPEVTPDFGITSASPPFIAASRLPSVLSSCPMAPVSKSRSSPVSPLRACCRSRACPPL